MLEKVRQKLLNFINSDKDVPLLTGFSIGIYMFLSYYSKNFSLANSYSQLLFFLAYYVLLPVSSIYLGFMALNLLKIKAYQRNFLFVSVIGFLGFYLLQINSIGFSKGIILAILLFAGTVLSVWLKKYYKVLVILLLLFAVSTIPLVISKAAVMINSSGKWNAIPDDITDIRFKNLSNIYYIQPDGYTSASNFKNEVYNFDNSLFEEFLSNQGFTLYSDYRSNYYSTLLSNSSMFSMRHHYARPDIEPVQARDVIVGNNAVLKILKKNGYTTNFITQSPYLLINRPERGYDYINFSEGGVPYLKDGFSVSRNVIQDLKTRMKDNGKHHNFYFLEYFTPGHIKNNKGKAAGAVQERKDYLARVNTANMWLKEVITHINTNDPAALIIRGADHGGFVGFNYMSESFTPTNNPLLVKSMYGALLAIKWNGKTFSVYDRDLKTSVNLFRTVFSYLAEDKKYLYNREEDGSYMQLDGYNKVFKYINDDGNCNLPTK